MEQEIEGGKDGQRPPMERTRESYRATRYTAVIDDYTVLRTYLLILRMYVRYLPNVMAGKSEAVKSVWQ